MILKKSIPLWIVILCFMFSITSSVALTISSLDSITVGIWESRVENTEFSTEEKKAKALNLCSKGFECELIDELNVGSIISNAQRIIESFKNI